MKNLKNKNGITLIALVITIIVMLILAAVSITMAVNGGLFGYAQNASAETEDAKVKEQKLGSGIVGGERIADLITGGTSVLPDSIIPEGGVYLRLSTGKVYYSSIGDTEKAIINGVLTSKGLPYTFDNFEFDGETAPEGIETLDAYLYGDYVYAYNFTDSNTGITIEGWNGQIWDTTKTHYDDVLNSINGEEITNMYATYVNCINLVEAPVMPANLTNMQAAFSGCTSLTKAPTIPSSVTNMSVAFQNCISLTKAPTIPNNVTNMKNTFSNCSLLTVVPAIPDSVTNMYSTFANCTSLTGTITINANPTNYLACFMGTIKRINLTGSSDLLDELAGTSNQENVHVI